MEKETKISNILNIAFLGLTASGKSSIINRLVNRSFYEVYNPTLLKTYNFLIHLDLISMNTILWIH